MKALKTADVTVNYRGEDKPGKIGYFIRKRPVLRGEEWVEGPDNEIIFGYCDPYGYVTHMSYGKLVLGDDSWEDFAVKSKHARKYDKFYFDAGSNGCPLYITYDELRRGMVELGIIDKDAIKDCVGCGHSKLIHDKESGGECTKIAHEDKDQIIHCPCAFFSGE